MNDRMVRSYLSARYSGYSDAAAFRLVLDVYGDRAGEPSISAALCQGRRAWRHRAIIKKEENNACA